MGARDQRPIVVTRPDHERLRILTESARARKRWEEMHLLALADELEHQPEAAGHPRRVVES